LAKFPVAVYAAVMPLLPIARLLAFTVSVAPADDSGALPRVTPPNENVTLPVGKESLLAGVTVARSCVDAVDAMVEG
jgi:hypothetical protein